jgi:hypothetical protein
MLNIPNNQASLSSEKLYRVVHPNPKPNDVTKYALTWLEHPTSDEVVLQWPPDLEIILPAGSYDNLMDFMAVLSYPVTEIEKQNFEELASTGGRIKLAEIMPASAQAAAKDNADLQDNGWFGAENFNELSRERLKSDSYPKIGDSLANAIVTEREQNDFFQSPSDVANRIDGIGVEVEQMLERKVDKGILIF